MNRKLYQLEAVVVMYEGGRQHFVRSPVAYVTQALAFADTQALIDAVKTPGSPLFVTDTPQSVDVYTVDVEVRPEPEGAVLVLNADQALWVKTLLADEQAYLRDAVRLAGENVPMSAVTKAFLALCLQVRKELGEPV